MGAASDAPDGGTPPPDASDGVPAAPALSPQAEPFVPSHPVDEDEDQEEGSGEVEADAEAVVVSGWRR